MAEEGVKERKRGNVTALIFSSFLVGNEEIEQVQQIEQELSVIDVPIPRLKYLFLNYKRNHQMN